MIDLHTHSTASDGSLTPQALARAGKAAGLTTMALTDHDCAKGLPDFLATAREIGLHAIPGIELSAEVPRGQLHLVGLAFDYQNPALCNRFERLLNGRSERNDAILAAFNEQGIDLTQEEVRAFAGDELISRVHFALALVKRGLVKDVKEAFERYLAKGACCYRNRFRYTPEACIRMVREAGGLVMMAHPLSLNPNLVELEGEIAALRDLGLAGMECYYSTYDTETTIALLRIAHRLNLIPSVGSDFHGVPKPTIHLGQLSIPPAAEERLLQALAAAHH